ncbi:helix-turn-helix domain-containing protein [Acetobacter pomorum]|uniref:helix-turn-helix domain-containing protein n=1 Tax=Acetobacter pomorum TaxID=65959 RepID=UPI000AC27A07|nr:helix-turn-helix domain-containing protein [Acetobacter pomorum]
MTPFPVEEIRNRLADAVELAGSQTAWARKAGVSRSIVSEVLSQKRDIPESIINALGYIVRPMCVPARKGMNR